MKKVKPNSPSEKIKLKRKVRFISLPATFESELCFVHTFWNAGDHEYGSKQVIDAVAGNGTRVNCLESSYAHYDTNIACSTQGIIIFISYNYGTNFVANEGVSIAQLANWSWLSLFSDSLTYLITIVSDWELIDQLWGLFFHWNKVSTGSKFKLDFPFVPHW